MQCQGKIITYCGETSMYKVWVTLRDPNILFLCIFWGICFQIIYIQIHTKLLNWY